MKLGRRIFSLPALISFAIAITLIYFLATSFDLNWGESWDKILSLDPVLYVLAVITYYLTFIFRGFRWRVLVQNASSDGETTKQLPSVIVFSQMILMSWFVNAIAYLRLGDPYRAYAFSSRFNKDFSWSLGTVLAERFIDMAIVVVLFLIGVTWYSATQGIKELTMIVGASFAMSFLLAVILLLMRNYGILLADFLPNRLKWPYHEFRKGTLGSLGNLRFVLPLGIIGWLLEFGRLYFVTQAIAIEVPSALILIVALGHAILRTVPTPGGIGAVEPGVTGLLMLRLARSDAVSIALVDRTITYLSIIVFGGIAFLLWQLTNHSENLRLGQAINEPSDREVS